MFPRLGITGNARVKNLILLSVVLAAGYFGFKFVPHYIDYYRVRNMFAAEANTGRNMPVEYIKGNVLRKVKELNLPVPEENVVVEMEDKTVRIYANYSVIVGFLFGYYTELEFAPYVEKDFK
ncbi:MAG TPA: hypothetical protein VII00_00100 [bacterium]